MFNLFLKLIKNNKNNLLLKQTKYLTKIEMKT